VTFDGTNWVNIGASVDHNATLNRAADDAHSQYQLGSAKDANGGYAGLDGGGLVIRPVKALRVASPDVTSPNPGEVWVNGVDLKYRNSSGGGQTEAVERQAMKDQNSGYAGLDGGGLVNKAVKAVRTSSDPVSPAAGEMWVNSGLLKYRDAAGSPATQVVEVQGNRDQNGGYAGLDGGGVVTRPVKGVRAGGGDPGTPGSGEVWVNGAALKYVDASGSPAVQIVEVQGNRDQNGGYAALDGGGVVNKPVRAIRTASPDPGSPNPGDVWVNGGVVKYRDASGSPATQILETQGNRDQNGGYAALDGGGAVNKPVKAIRTASPDPGSPSPGDVWVNGGVVKYRDASGLPATQILETQGNRDQNGGYAALDAGGAVNKPVKAIRTASPDPGSPSAGDVWVNGVDLKYRNNNGGGAQTDTVERQANKDQNGGYAGLDGGGLVGKPVKAIRLASPDPGSPSPGDVWVNGTDLKFRDNGGSPATRSAVSAGRQVLTGAGMTGGGDLTADRTVSISAFSGVVSKDFDPASLSWTAGEIKVHQTYDVGVDGQLLPVGIRLPATVNSALRTEAVLEFDDGSSKVITNAATAATLDSDGQGLAYALMGDLNSAANANGRRVRKIKIQTRNNDNVNPVNNVDVGVFRVRAWASPRGGGSAL
jgi:hypothetical protein